MGGGLFANIAEKLQTRKSSAIVAIHTRMESQRKYLYCLNNAKLCGHVMNMYRCFDGYQ